MKLFKIITTIIIGLLVGISAGFVFGWIIWPIQFIDATPELLQEGYQEDYALMVAAAYAGDGNLAAAQTKLSHLGRNGQEILLAYTIDRILAGEETHEVRYLAQLSADLGLDSAIIEPYLSSLPPAS